MSCGGGPRFTTALSGRTWLSKRTFELTLDRPEGFDFVPGQGICLGEGPGEREYSLASGREEARLTLCIRRVENGPLSSWLATVPPGDRIFFSGPHGFFTWQDSPRPAIFVATGTGIAPFPPWRAADAMASYSFMACGRRRSCIMENPFVPPPFAMSPASRTGGPPGRFRAG